MSLNYDTYISFYLSSNRVHIFTETLHYLGDPAFVRFRLSHDPKSMIMEAYDRLEFTSLRVPNREITRSKRNQMEVHSTSLCQIIKDWFCWTDGLSYRVPGRYIKKQNIIFFDLSKAYAINPITLDDQAILYFRPGVDYAVYDC